MKNEFKVLLNEMVKVKVFCALAAKLNCDIDVIKDRYVIDGKSIMGLFSLDLSKPIYVKLHSNDEIVLSGFKNSVKEYMVD